MSRAYVCEYGKLLQQIKTLGTEMTINRNKSNLLTVTENFINCNWNTLTETFS